MPSPISWAPHRARHRARRSEIAITLCTAQDANSRPEFPLTHVFVALTFEAFCKCSVLTHLRNRLMEILCFDTLTQSEEKNPGPRRHVGAP